MATNGLRGWNAPHDEFEIYIGFTARPSVAQILPIITAAQAAFEEVARELGRADAQLELVEIRYGSVSLFFRVVRGLADIKEAVDLGIAYGDSQIAMELAQHAAVYAKTAWDAGLGGSLAIGWRPMVARLLEAISKPVVDGLADRATIRVSGEEEPRVVVANDNAAVVHEHALAAAGRAPATAPNAAMGPDASPAPSEQRPGRFFSNAFTGGYRQPADGTEQRLEPTDGMHFDDLIPGAAPAFQARGRLTHERGGWTVNTERGAYAALPQSRLFDRHLDRGDPYEVWGGLIPDGPEGETFIVQMIRPALRPANDIPLRTAAKDAVYTDDAGNTLIGRGAGAALRRARAPKGDVPTGIPEGSVALFNGYQYPATPENSPLRPEPTLRVVPTSPEIVQPMQSAGILEYVDGRWVLARAGDGRQVRVGNAEVLERELDPRMIYTTAGQFERLGFELVAFHPQMIFPGSPRP